MLRLRRSDPVLADQLHRAMISIPLNIAEGAGEFSPADKARFYRYSLRSCTESLAILDVCNKIQFMKPAEHVACETGDRVVAMLTRLVASAADRAARRSASKR
ncbi:MAG: four helix bundle protein [Longimicrobiales bacterium]